MDLTERLENLQKEMQQREAELRAEIERLKQELEHARSC
jgi:uncharacterized small protein (DUF1192 family)